MNQALTGLMDRMPVLEPGHVWLVGAGPGDPGYLSLFALAGLAQADVVVHDALVDQRVLDLARPEATRVFAGKRGGRPSVDQADVTAQLVALAREGRRVLRLKGGDPFVFGRGGEEALTLALYKVPFRVVPGATAGLAGLAAALIPATLRGINQAIVLATGHDAEGADGLDWAALARLGQPIVLYMGMANIERIAAELIAGGMAAETAAAVIASATLPGERVLVSTLGALPAAVRTARLSAPALVAIGEIVAIRGRLLELMPGIEGALHWPAART